jgi:predicted permease
VEEVATTTNLPLHRKQYGLAEAFELPDQSGSDVAPTARSQAVSPAFFRLLQIRQLAGRSLQPSDRTGSPGVAVVNETFARRFLPGREALGQRIRYTENPWVPGDVGFQLSHRTVDEVEIVGVVDDVKYLALGDPPEPSIYLSSEQWTNRRRTVLVRTTLENPENLVAAIRGEIDAMDPLLSAEFALYPPIVRASIAGERLAATLLVIFGVVALALAAVGIYGLMSYSVTQRTGEIAVRSAMGASERQVLNLVLGRGVRLALAGIVLGVIGAVVLRQAVASQLYGVTALDPRVFVVASLILFSVAALACFVPAQRATRIDPADLFRRE